MSASSQRPQQRQGATAENAVGMQPARESPWGSERTHVLKCWPEPFQAMREGRKTHETRRNDRGYEVGDLLQLREFDPSSQRFTGRLLLMRVSYISRGPDWGLPLDLVVMSIRRER